jgi:hypothetical protein
LPGLSGAACTKPSRKHASGNDADSVLHENKKLNCSTRETTMSPQRTLMIEAMILAGLAAETQKAYLRAVWQLAAYYRR